MSFSDRAEATAPLIQNADPEDDGTGVGAHTTHNTAAETVNISTRRALNGRGTWFIWVLTFSAAVSGLLFGYDTGVISSTLVSIKTDLSNRPLTVLDKSLITSCTSLFALFASPAAGILADRHGRRVVVIVADVFFVAGALIQALTSTVTLMIVGRSIVGCAVGAASLVVPMYISELAPAHLRGRLITISSLLITGGQVVAYVVGWLFSTVGGGWRWMVGLGCVPAAVQLVFLLFMPETPRWLVKAGHKERARRILSRVYGDDDAYTAREVMHDIETEILAAEQAEAGTDSSPAATNDSSRKASWLANLSSTMTELLRTPGHRRALTIACFLQGLQQLCGFNSLMYFSATIFAMLGFASPTLTSLSVAITNWLFTLVAFGLIDRLGRRRILLVTIPCMAFALLLCASAFSYLDFDHIKAAETSTEAMTDSSRVPALTVLVSMILYVSSYASGIGIIPWSQSELFTLRVRSVGSSLATGTNWACNTLVGLTFLPMLDTLGGTIAFSVYAILCAVGWVVVLRIYPEMSGLRLEEVGGLLESGWGVKESLEIWEERKRRTNRRVE